MTQRGRSLDVLATLPLIVFLTLLFIGCTAQVSGPPTPPTLLTSPPVDAYKTRHVFIVVMDGVRYSETFGDTEHRFIPHLFNDLRPQGTLFTHYYNRGVTVTRQGHSTLISGTWQSVPNGGPRLTRPTLFEYYRDEKRAPPMACWSVFGKGSYAFAPYSSHPAYGSRFAGRHVHGGGSKTPVNENGPEGDQAVLNKVIDVMRTDRPDILFVNFGYTDHKGHVAKDIGEYQSAVKNCDEQMWKLWNAVQLDPHYRDTTTVFFTNDHGRHTTDFRSHGDHCEGCEHIMLLVLGPDIKRGVVVKNEALQIDVATTAGELLGLQTPLAEGRVLSDCLNHYFRLNKKEARTEAARHALYLEGLADRSLMKVVADHVLTTTGPETLPANLAGEVVVRGMLRAHNETKDQRYLQFVEKWIDFHKRASNVEQQTVVGKVILELPAPIRRQHMDFVLQISDRSVASQLGVDDPSQALMFGVFLGRLSEVTQRREYEELGLRIVKAGLRQPTWKPSTDLEKGYQLLLLGQAAALFRDDITVMKVYILAAAEALNKMKEDGDLWDDPLVSVLNLSSIDASRRRGAMREFTQRRERDDLPACVKVLALHELRPLFPDRPRAPLRNLQNQVAELIWRRGKQGLPFSLDMLRYGVNEADAYGDGALIAQGGFLLSFRRLQWRYGGSTWPGPEPTKQP